MPGTLAVIPARAGSKRLPGKNQRPLLGRPLILWTVDFALSYGGFDVVLVSTDSPEIAELARRAGALAPWLRPTELASDTASSVDVVLHAADAMASEGRQFDRVALLQPTTPVRVSQRWDEASAYIDAGAPAALGVREAPSHPYWTFFMGADAELVSCFPAEVARRSQDLPRAFVPNGALYLCRLNELRRHRSLTPPGTRGVVCDDPLESIDIDTQQDWLDAERAIQATGR